MWYSSDLIYDGTMHLPNTKAYCHIYEMSFLFYLDREILNKVKATKAIFKYNMAAVWRHFLCWLLLKTFREPYFTVLAGVYMNLVSKIEYFGGHI